MVTRQIHPFALREPGIVGLRRRLADDLSCLHLAHAHPGRGDVPLDACEETLELIDAALVEVLGRLEVPVVHLPDRQLRQLQQEPV